MGREHDPMDFTERQDDDSQSRSRELSAHGAFSLPGYELIEPIGRGAFGEVWRARQLSTDKDVAVKVFMRFHGLDWQFLRREVERLVALDTHPNIVSLLDAHLEREPPSYVMELVAGGSLGNIMRGGEPIPVERAVKWVGRIAEALQFVHSKGLLHCDLKPDNILVDGQDSIRLVDFGQSRLLTDASSGLGTLMYMAPEQASATDDGTLRHPDVRWDIYALGATAHALLTGSPPHASPEHRAELGQAASMTEKLSIYRGIVDAAPLPERITASDGSTLDADLSSIINTCLAPNPEQRYASATDVLEDLNARVTHRPVTARHGGIGYRAWKLARRRTARVVTVLACVVIAGGALGGWMWQRSRAEQVAQLNTLVETGNQLVAAKDWAAAEASFRSALTIDPNDFRALANFGRFYMMRSRQSGEDREADLVAALGYYDRALEIEWNLGAINARGAAYSLSGRFGDAVADYESVVAADESQYPAWVNLAMARARLGKIDDAGNAARTAVKWCDQIITETNEGVTPEIADTTKRCANAYLTLGTLQLLRGDSGALRYLDQAIASDPTLPRARLMHARALLTVEGEADPSLALKELNVAEALGQKNKGLGPYIDRLRGLAHVSLGNASAALDAADRATRFGDLATPNHLVMACALSLQDHTERADARRKQADAEWPKSLAQTGDHYFAPPGGPVFWFESYDELAALRNCQTTIPR